MTLQKLNCWEYMKSDKEISQFMKKMDRRLAKAGERILKQGKTMTDKKTGLSLQFNWQNY